MTKNKAYLILQSVLCVLSAALLAGGAIGIYRDGMAVRASGDVAALIYTPQKVAERFGPIAPFLFLAVGFGIAGLVLGVRDEKAARPVKDAQILRDLACSRVQEPSQAMQRERGLQKKLWLGGWAVFFLCMVPIVLYMINPEPFHPETLEADFFALLRGICPWTLAGFACLIITTSLMGKSMLRETEAAKAQAAEEKSRSADAAAPEEEAVKTEDTRSHILHKERKENSNGRNI